MTTPPSAGETTADGANSAQLRRELAARALGALRPHEQPRALEIAVGVEPGGETEVAGEKGAGLFEVLEGDHGADSTGESSRMSRV